MKFRLGAEQYTYKTVERRISTASIALGLARTSMPGRQHHLTNLKKFTRYSVVVQAFNALGPGPMSQEVVASTLEDGKRPWNIASISICVPTSNSCARKINNRNIHFLENLGTQDGNRSHSEAGLQTILIRLRWREHVDHFSSAGCFLLLSSLTSRFVYFVAIARVHFGALLWILQQATNMRDRDACTSGCTSTRRELTRRRDRFASPRSPARGRVSGRKSRRLFPHFTIRASSKIHEGR